MNKPEVIANLQKILKSTGASDFSGATADTMEAAFEQSAKQLLAIALNLFELSSMYPDTRQG